MPVAATLAPHPRWVLAPGLRVVRRGRDRLQVGLDTGVRVVVPRSPTALALLSALATGSPLPEDPAAGVLLTRLRERGVVVTSASARPALARVGLRLVGLDAPPLTADLLVPLGLEVTRWEQDAGAVLVISVGEPSRELLDPLVRDGVPHLLLRLTDGGATLGPFVQPGFTACLRCLDAQLATDDPERGPVLLRYVEASRRRRDDGIGDLSDPPLLTLGLAWAARDLLDFARGVAPSTWSRTLQWHPGAPEPTGTAWLRHPGCGCAWTSAPTLGGLATGMSAGASGTMEA